LSGQSLVGVLLKDAFNFLMECSSLELFLEVSRRNKLSRSSTVYDRSKLNFVMLNVVILNVVILSVVSNVVILSVIPTVIMTSVIMISVIILGIIILNVVMLTIY
jgi:hypothetical protein